MAALPELSVWAVLDSGQVPLWQRTLLEALGKQAGCSLATWDGAPSTEATGRGPSHLFRRYERWDRRRFEKPGDTLALVDPPPLPGAPRSGERPDLVLWLTDRPLPERSPEGVRHGIWYVRQGAARADRDAPLFAEVRAGDGTAVTSLCALVGDRERVLAGSTGPADRVSLHRSRVRAYARAALLPLRAIGRLGADSAPAPEPPLSRPRGPSTAATAATAGLTARIAARMVRRRLRSLLFDPRWVVAYRRLEEGESPLALTGRYRTLLPPPGRAFADPFVVEDPSGDAMLMEDYRPNREPGAIVAVELDPGGDAGAPEPVLSGDTHLSYPFVMRDGGELYMVPESRKTEEVELLRATDFPLGWVRERTLMDVPATDSTLFRHDGRIWLFTALSPDGDAAVDELHLFSAPGLDGAWTPHPGNPVVADVRSARPAGALFHHEGQLLRPAQDCSRAYGWRVVLNRVETLTESEYRETPVGQIEPASRLIRRTHTFNHTAHWEALDAHWLAPRLFPRSGPRTVRFRLRRYPTWQK